MPTAAVTLSGGPSSRRAPPPSPSLSHPDPSVVTWGEAWPAWRAALVLGLILPTPASGLSEQPPPSILGGLCFPLAWAPQLLHPPSQPGAQLSLCGRPLSQPRSLHGPGFRITERARLRAAEGRLGRGTGEPGARSQLPPQGPRKALPRQPRAPTGNRAEGPLFPQDRLRPHEKAASPGMVPQPRHASTSDDGHFPRPTRPYVSHPMRF